MGEDKGMHPKIAWLRHQLRFEFATHVICRCIFNSSILSIKNTVNCALFDIKHLPFFGIRAPLQTQNLKPKEFIIGRERNNIELQMKRETSSSRKKKNNNG